MERIGFVGLGTMGAAMAANLRRAGFEVTRVEPDAGPGRGARRAGRRSRPPRRPTSPRASDVVVVCVSDTPDVEAVLFGADGVADGLAAGGLVIDCSTISPAATAGFAARLRERGIGFVDAPVSGGSEGARHATLTIFVGGEPADVERARPGARGDGHDDHPLRARGQRPGGQGGQPGRDRGRLPRRGRGHGPRDEGRPGPGGGRGRARRRRGARAGSSRTAAGG